VPVNESDVKTRYNNASFLRYQFNIKSSVNFCLIYIRYQHSRSLQDPQHLTLLLASCNMCVMSGPHIGDRMDGCGFLGCNAVPFETSSPISWPQYQR
jgi:hypothetical protein